MSESTKKIAKEAKEAFKVVQKEADLYKKSTLTMDKELSKKIERVEEAAREVVKHIDDRSEGG